VFSCRAGRPTQIDLDSDGVGDEGGAAFFEKSHAEFGSVEKGILT
jgi:hypothetical protein